MKLLAVLILNLPKILKLLENMQARIDQAEEDKKVAQDLDAINKAFEDGDNEALRRIFNS
jgi:hypothetical protein